MIRSRNDNTLEAKLEAMDKCGQMTIFPSLEAARREHGEIVINKAASIVKILEDGSDKHRLIIDMLRSMANSRCRVPQRGVLPRVFDATADARRMIFLSQGGGFPEILVLDLAHLAL